MNGTTLQRTVALLCGRARGCRSLNYLLDSLDAFQKKVIKSEAILKASNVSLEHKTAELRKMNEFMVGRELKMIELKKEIERLGGKRFESTE